MQLFISFVFYQHLRFIKLKPTKETVPIRFLLHSQSHGAAVNLPFHTQTAEKQVFPSAE